MNEQMGQEILQRIDVLAAKLGIAAEYLWDVLVRQQVLVNGWVTLACGIVALVVGILCWRPFWGFMAEAQSSWRVYMEEGCGTILERKAFGVNTQMAGVCILLGLVGGISLVMAIACIIGGVSHLINPAYYAFRAIVGG